MTTDQNREARTPWVILLLAFPALIAAHTGLRLLLISKFGPSGAPLFQMLGIGLVADCFAALAALLPAVLLLALLPSRIVRWRAARFALMAALFGASALAAFFFVAEFFFFAEFKSRFNTVAVDYLLYPHEIFVNIWDTYPLGRVVVACGLAGLGAVLAVRRISRGAWETNLAWPLRSAVLIAWVGALYLLWPRVGNQLTRFSSDRLLNELAGNGWYSFAQAAVTREFEYAPFYKTMPMDAAYARVRGLLQQTNAYFLSDTSIVRLVQGRISNPKLNVVVLLEESLGAEFFGCLGRTLPTCTPRLDQLSKEGLLFTNIYASGNRTVRGMEGVLCSFPPLPGDSVVVRSGGKHIETLARVLKRDGYTNTFIYAGRGTFDHVRSFMLANGYDRFIEQKDFENPIFSTIWGVCNEDLYTRGLQECRRASESGQPFFLTMLSVSNHEPFKYPPGRIPEDPNARVREHAVKYTDYAIGQFFEAAKKEPFWTNTVFVVVADHGARVYGSETIPMKSYEIPFLVLGPSAVQQARSISTQGGQMDVAPTILGLIGRPHRSGFFGRDLFQIAPETGRSFLNHNRDIGLFSRETLVVLGLNKTVEYYEGNPKRGGFHPAADPSDSARETEADAVALFEIANDIYLRDGFRAFDRPAAAVKSPELTAGWPAAR